MTDEQREFNGRMIEEMCRMGESLIDLAVADIKRQYSDEEVIHGLPRWRWQQFDAAKDYHE